MGENSTPLTADVAQYATLPIIWLGGVIVYRLGTEDGNNFCPFIQNQILSPHL